MHSSLYPEEPARFRARVWRTNKLMIEPQRLYANVILDMPAREIRDRLFSYAVPTQYKDEVFAGTQVLVPFGHSGQVNGYVVSFSNLPPAGVDTKAILDVLDAEPLFDSDYVDFLHWVADYYAASFADVMSAAVPSFLAPRIKRKVRLAPNLDLSSTEAIADRDLKTLVEILRDTKGGALSPLTLRQRWKKLTRGNNAQFYRALTSLKAMKIVESAQEKTAASSAKTVRSVLWTGQDCAEKRPAHIIEVLRAKGGQMRVSDLLEAAGTTGATVKRMVENGLLTYRDEEVIRDPLSHLKNSTELPPAAVSLTIDQARVFDTLKRELLNKLDGKAESNEKFWLLHGITGSGKTEIYLRLIAETIANGRTALLLVPEISLTPQSAQRLTERFGDAVSVWHSALTPAERFDTWHRLKNGHTKVLLGARSAVLVDLPKLGLIIIDEEHDGSYKQATPSPRYNAKEVAIEKATRCGALVVFGSATPDVSAYYNAQQSETILELPKRVFDQPLPETRLVDMRAEFLNGNRSIFSNLLIDALEKCLEGSDQAILLMNRRGFASHVFCRACGFVVVCKHCSVTMVYHQSPGGRPASGNGDQRGNPHAFLACHHCGFRSENPTVCPSCDGPFIKQFGIGTQRIEYELRDRFPKARILRLDSDVTSKRGAQEKILGDFSHGQADFLIGTQMVSKGLDIERVTVVGVLAADAAFNMPDYRSLERGFQLLTQVAGRAGRGTRPGLVVLQTYNTEMPALELACRHDYKSFYEVELANRQAFDYPPFSQILRIVVAAEDAGLAERECERLAEGIANFVDESVAPSQMQILGPAPCLIEKLRNKFRMHLIVKNKAGEEGRALLARFFRTTSVSEGVQVAIDVDALDLV
jgi:primosomal protein N' (replication factor Y) (superfamily II helicase)